MSKDDSPCSVCQVSKKCCRDMGLKLSEYEYKKHFRKYSERFDVIRYKKITVVYPRENLPCPYLTSNGCKIYLDRPVDCQLYPYELNRIVERKKEILIDFYDQTDCPHKEKLFLPLDEAKELMRRLAVEIYGYGKTVKFNYQPGKKAPRRFGPLNALISKVSLMIRSVK